MRKIGLVQRAVALIVGHIVLGSAIAATPAGSLGAAYALDIPAQSLNDALQALALASKHELLYPAKLVDGMSSAPLKGKFTTEEAIKQLLAGTDLTYEVTSDGLVVIRDRNSSTRPLSSVADGQTAEILLAQSDSTDKTEVKDPNKGDASKEEDPKKIEEVIVTAQKRKESLQEVPISISVVSGADLDRSSVQGITEALRRVPAVAVMEGIQGGGTQITIRGVTASGPLFNGGSTAAYYIDSVPFGSVRSAIAPDPTAYDLERVEVLRGPQGTLYGAGGVSGVVRILTHDANLDAFEFKARTSASSTDDGGENYRGDVAINVPIVEDKLAVRAVLGYNDLSGWIDGANYDDINDAQLANARLKLKARPTENLTIGLSAWASRNDYGAPTNSLDNRTHPTALPEQPIESDFTAYGLNVGYDFGTFSVSSATSYIDYSTGGDLDLVPGGTDTRLFTGVDSSVFSQEVLLNSTGDGPWQWSLGGFYRDAEDVNYQEWRGVGTAPTCAGLPGGVPPCPGARWIDTSKSYAVFGELSRRFFHDQLKWTLGLRYFHDDGTYEGFVQDPDGFSSATYKATTPRAVLTWTPSSDLSVYGSYSQGFRSGLDQYEPTKVNAPSYPPAEPDKLNNYEIGAKGNVLNQRVSFEVALFYIDWKDVQQSVTVRLVQPTPSLPNGVNGPAVINGVSASGLGADFALTVRPTERLELGATLGWNDLTQDEAVFSGTGARVFAAGDRLEQSPEYTASGFAEYAFPLGSGFEGRFSSSVNYTSHQDAVSGGGVRAKGDDMTIARASFSLEAPEHWAAMLYVDNLNDEDSVVIRQFGGAVNDTRIRPRTVGLQFEYRY